MRYLKPPPRVHGSLHAQLGAAAMSSLLMCSPFGGGEATAGDLPAPSATGAPSRFLERIESPVYETEGDHQAITKRAITCIAQTIKPGLTAVPTIISSDLDAGTIVANNQFIYTFGLGNMLTYTARTILTFQAKDGRFRIINTDIEDIYSGRPLPGSGPDEWQKVINKKYAGANVLTSTVMQIDDKLAACVKNNTSTNDNW
jgi:hypothetical protein